VSTPAPPIWREAGAGLELAALLMDPVWRGAGVADGGGRSVLLVPGFLASDRSLLLMAHWLHRRGYRPWTCGLRSNRDCADRTLARLADRLEARVAASGERVAIIGQSRGGVLARALAVRCPHLLSGVVALGSPLRDQLAVHPVVRGAVRRVAALGDLGVAGMFSSECHDGPCCARFRAELAGPFPRDVALVAVYSRTDGIVDWRACLDPEARHVEVHSSHVGMSAHPGVYRAIADALPGFWPPAEVVPLRRRTPSAATRR
jgi:triacylglycerol lipase